MSDKFEWTKDDLVMLRRARRRARIEITPSRDKDKFDIKFRWQFQTTVVTLSPEELRDLEDAIGSLAFG